MNRTTIVMTLALMAGIALGQLGNQALNAQNAGPTRTDLSRTNLAEIEGKEAIMLTVEGGPGLVGGKHYHPGEEFANVLEGSLILEVEGKPPVTYQAGDTFHISPEVVHSGKNTSSTAPYKVLVFGVFEKGKPDTTFVP